MTDPIANPFGGVTYDDAGNITQMGSNEQGQDVSPVSIMGGGGFEDIIAGLSTGGSVSKDEEIAEYKRKGYIFSKDGRIWNKDQSKSVGSWDVQGWVDEQQKSGKSAEEVMGMLNEGVTWDQNKDGSYISRGVNQPAPAGTTHGVARTPAPGGTSSYDRERTNAAAANERNRQDRQAAADRASAERIASAGGGGGPIQGVGNTPPPSIGPGGGGGGGGGDAFIDPKAPLGIPPIVPGGNPGSDYFQPGGGMPSAGNPFEGLGPDSNIMDVIAAVTGGQVANQQAALDTLGGVFRESQGGVSEQQRGRIGDLLSNPFSLDENTMQRIMGQNTQGINNRAQRQMEESQQRRASAGIRPDSGIAQAQDQQISTNAANQAQTQETQARIQQAIQNQTDMRSAIGTAGPAIQQDIGLRERLAQGAAQGVLGETAIKGDAFTMAAMLGAQNPGGNQGPQFQDIWSGGVKNRTRLPNSSGY